MTIITIGKICGVQLTTNAAANNSLGDCSSARLMCYSVLDFPIQNRAENSDPNGQVAHSVIECLSSLYLKVFVRGLVFDFNGFLSSGVWLWASFLFF